MGILGEWEYLHCNHRQNMKRNKKSDKKVFRVYKKRKYVTHLGYSKEEWGEHEQSQRPKKKAGDNQSLQDNQHLECQDYLTCEHLHNSFSKASNHVSFTLLSSFV